MFIGVMILLKLFFWSMWRICTWAESEYFYDREGFSKIFILFCIIRSCCKSESIFL